MPGQEEPQDRREEDGEGQIGNSQGKAPLPSKANKTKNLPKLG